MKKKNMEVMITKVLKDWITKEVVGVEFSCEKKLYKVSLKELSNLKVKGYNIINAVLDKRGVLRAKHGQLSEKFVSWYNLQNYINNRVYDGNMNKYGITLNGVDYIVKEKKGEYDTSIYSEYVVSKIEEYLGYNVHEVYLYQNNGEHVVVLKDFAIGGYKLKSFKDIAQSSLETDSSTKDYTYTDVVYMLNKHKKLSKVQKERVIKQFWDMFMLDAIFANRDRHHGNWGYLSNGVSCKVAKIYDNGGCLFPNVITRLEEYEKNKKEFLFCRSERFPASLLKAKRRSGEIKRTNYYEYVALHSKNVNMDEAYQKVRQIGVEKLFMYAIKVCYCEYIPIELSEFYVSIICMRYLHIINRCSLDESYERLIGLWKSVK